MGSFNCGSTNVIPHERIRAVAGGFAILPNCQIAKLPFWQFGDLSF